MRNIRVEDKKIMRIREAKGVDQKVLARAMRAHVEVVRQVEGGNAHYNNAQLRHARKHLNLTNMPLTEFETATFKRRLYIMYDLVKDRRFSEAKDMCREMAYVLELDACDDDLPQLHRLFEAYILIYANNDLDAAIKKLEQYKSKHYEPTAEHNYHYNFLMGAIHTRRVDYEASLSFYMRAQELINSVEELTPEDIKRLHLGIASCYTYLGFPFKAITCLEKARGIHADRRANVISIHFDNELALNYIRVNELEIAEKLLEYSLICASSINDNFCIGLTLNNIGRLYKQRENLEDAVNYFERAADCFEKGSVPYVRAMYEAMHCWACLSKFAHAKRLLDKVKKLCNSEAYDVLYKALWHYIIVRSRMSIYNDESVEYLEAVALPYFEKTHDYFIAIDYYKLLEKYYQKKNDKKSLLMSEAIRRVYERCFFSANKQG